MRKIRITVPDAEMLGATVEHTIEVEDEHAERVVSTGRGTYVDEPEPTEPAPTVDGSDPGGQPVADKAKRGPKADTPPE